MASTLKAAFNPEMIDVLRRGIQYRNVADVKAALESGIDPNTYSYTGTYSLLHPLLLETYKRSEAAKVMDEATFKKSTSEIIDLLLQYGLTVAEPASKHEDTNARYLIDKYIYSDNLAETSKLVVRALAETLARKGNDVYEIHTLSQIRRYLSGFDFVTEDQVRTGINQSLGMLAMLHETVRQRLLNPTSKEEEQLVAKHREKIGYWLQPFQAPSNAAVMHRLFAPPKDPAPESNTDITKGGPMTGVKQDQGKPRAAQGGHSNEDDEAVKEMIQVLEKRPAAEVMAEIERDFVGLDSAKEALYDIMVGEEYDLACVMQDVEPTPERHSAVFLGSPGLGKTTFARKYAEVLHAVGVAGPNYVEVGPANVVGKYLGHTEARMEAILKAADVVFIDEAYDLVASGGGNTADLGKKVLTSVLRAIENNPKMVVIMAGYGEEMNKLISANVGLSSRITKHIHFEDMDREALGKTLDLMAKQGNYTVAADARAHILDQIEAARQQVGRREFGNARLVRNVVDRFRATLGRRFFGDAAKAGASKAFVEVPNVKQLRHVTLQDAQAINYGMALGLASKKKAVASDAAPNDPAFQPSIGFGRPLREAPAA